jgi:hypothetical protein
MVDEKLHRLLEDEKDVDAAFAAWSQHHDANRALMFHETYHYWQGLRLPFLYRYAVAATRNIFLVFRALSHDSLDWHRWSAQVPALHMLNVERRCVRWSETQVGLVPDNYKENDFLEESVISITELLEGATSLAEWQVSATSNADAVNPVLFARWRKRTPSYDRVYRFVSKIVGDAIAIRCCLPLINASFYTSDPVVAFVGLLAVLGGRLKTEWFQSLLNKPEPLHWDEIFAEFLDKLDYTAPVDAHFDVTSPLGFYRLSLEGGLAVSYRGSDFAHPFLTQLAREWLDLQKTVPQYSWMLSLPRWFDDVGGAYARFAPPLTVAHFQLTESKSRTVFIGDYNRGMSLQKMPLLEFLTVYGAVRRATGAFFDRADRLCHHRDCPYFDLNYCNSYPVIPKLFEACGFPDRMNDLVCRYSTI